MTLIVKVTAYALGWFLRCILFLTPTHYNINYMQLPYKNYRTGLTNRLGSISCYIIPLVIYSFRDRHKNTHTDFPNKNQAHTGCNTWFKKGFATYTEGS